jgi:hypothetical protein
MEDLKDGRDFPTKYAAKLYGIFYRRRGRYVFTSIQNTLKRLFIREG